MDEMCLEADLWNSALVDAIEQILDDMGKTGLCVSLYAKAQARIAIEPFGINTEDFMPLDEALKIVDEYEG
jgi:hypothetical protein